MPLTFWQSVLYQEMLGNRYSTSPKGYVRFVLVSMPTDLLVQARPFATLQSAFGQERSTDIDNVGTNATLQSVPDEVSTKAAAATPH